MEKMCFPPERFRTDASDAYLRQPILRGFLSTDKVLEYSNLADVSNRLFDLITQGILTPDNRKDLKVKCLSHLVRLKDTSTSIQSALQKVLQTIGPLAAI